MSPRLDRRTQDLLAESAVFLGVGATLGVFGALAWMAGALWPQMLAGALALGAGWLLRDRLATGVRSALDWVLRRADIALETRSAQPALRLLGPAVGVAVAAAAFDAQGVWAWSAQCVAASLAVLAVFGALAALAGPFLEDIVDLDSLLGAATARLASRAVAAAILAVGATAMLEIWGAPAAAAVVALGLVGLAAAIAARDQLRDLAAGLAIEQERRIRVGDHVEVIGVNGLSGLVVETGLRTVRLVRDDGAIVDAPNATLHQAATIIRPATAPETAFPAADDATGPLAGASRRGDARSAGDNGAAAHLSRAN